MSLEPCSFSGRTGACVTALLEAGIVRVVSAMEDPNPRVAGNGNRLLLEAGIAVGTGLLGAEAASLNRGYIQRLVNGKPFIRCKMAMSLDGRTAMASGESQWITSPAARKIVQTIRAQSCALITGIGTVLNDDPALTVRESELGSPVERQPAIVVVDSRLRIPLDAKLLQPLSGFSFGRKVYIACGSDADPAKKAKLKKMGVEVMTLPYRENTEAEHAQSGSALSLIDLIDQLATKPFNELLVEAGSSLAGAFVAQGLVDQLDLFALGRPEHAAFDRQIAHELDRAVRQLHPPRRAARRGPPPPLGRGEQGRGQGGPGRGCPVHRRAASGAPAPRPAQARWRLRRVAIRCAVCTGPAP